MSKIKEDSTLAEFIGILLGDGSIGRYESKVAGQTKTQYRVKVTGDATEDLDYFKTVVTPLTKNIFGKEPKLRFKKEERTAELLLFGPIIFDSLIEIGLIESPKKGRAKVPHFITDDGFQRDLLRGFFDTDGSLVFDRQHKERHYYPRLEMKIGASPMRGQILEMLRNLDFGPRICQQDGGIWRVQINGKAKLERWSEEIGFNNPKHLTKRLFWQEFGYYLPGLTLQERYKCLRGNRVAHS